MPAGRPRRLPAGSPRTRRSRSAAGSSTPACTSCRCSPTTRSGSSARSPSPRSRPSRRARRCSAVPSPIPHTRLGQTADLVVVAPATAKLIGKYAAGISDDLLTATLLATRAPVLVCPAMHTEMWEHAAVQENLATLRRRGRARARARGRAGSRAATSARAGSPIPERIVARVLALLAAPAGALAGRTRARDRGRHPRADRSGALRRQPVVGEDGPRDRATSRAGAARSVVLVTTADQPVAAGRRGRAGRDRRADARRGARPAPTTADVVVMAAAVADFRPKAVAPREAEEGRRRARDRARADRRHPRRARRAQARRARSWSASRPRPSGLREHAAAKLAAKQVDLMVANDVSAADAGFEVDTNRALVLDARRRRRGAAAADEGRARRLARRADRASRLGRSGDPSA